MKNRFLRRWPTLRGGKMWWRWQRAGSSLFSVELNGTWHAGRFSFSSTTVEEHCHLVKTDGGPFLESQRDSVSKPRVVAHATTLGLGQDEFNPNGVASRCGHPNYGATPLGLFEFPLLPRVARSSQPWALRRNPVGIDVRGQIPKQCVLTKCQCSGGEAGERRLVIKTFCCIA
jgi:hypothetical protein